MDPKMAIDTAWVMVAAALVFFMNAGFALLEAGLCREKNTANILAKNLMVFCIAALAYWAGGYALMFGGADAMFVDGSEPATSNLPTIAFVLFQACFAATACSIISGVVAERIKYGAFLLASLLFSLIVYPTVGRWTWGGGFLAEWGFHDFAGSLVVHSFGGFAALVGAMMLGPRLGRFDANGKPQAIPGHSMPLATLGTFILWLGWFGFNAGSVLGIDASVPRITIVTVLSACAGGVSATLMRLLRHGKPDLAYSLNGALAGLVGITAACAVVHPAAAVIIGLVSGTLVVLTDPLLERFRIDDAVGAIGVHLVGGLFGTLAVGLFAAPDLRLGPEGEQLPYGLFTGGGMELLSIQALAIVIVGLFSLIAAFGVWSLVRRLTGLRVSAEEELIGLDLSEMGMTAYAPDAHPVPPPARDELPSAPLLPAPLTKIRI